MAGDGAHDPSLTAFSVRASGASFARIVGAVKSSTILALSLCLASCRTQPSATSVPPADVVNLPDVVDAVADVPAVADAPEDAPPDVLSAPCGATNSAALMACVRRDELLRDTTAVAMPRAPGSAHHGVVRDLCATRLAALGFTVERHDYGSGVNVLGVKPGLDPTAPRVLVSAHYDHVASCPGADDNASGVAGALEVARVLAQGRYDRTLVVACWDEEERGLVGSAAYVRRAHAMSDRVAVSYVFEMIGYRATAPDSQQLPQGIGLIFPRQVAQIRDNENRGDFITLIADETARDAAASLERAAQAVGLPTISLSLTAAQTGSPLFSTLQRSDHAPFWVAGYPAIQITDTAEFRNPRYHCRNGQDTVESLDFEFMTRVVQATVGAAADSLGVR